MVSAQLLGQIELAVSRVVPARSPYIKKANNVAQPFGGINVLLFCDMWQLKPDRSDS